MKKRILAGILSGIIALSFTACGNDNEESSSSKKKNKATEAAEIIDEEISETDAETEAVTETEPATEPPTEPINEEELFMKFINGESKAFIDRDLKCDASYACCYTDQNIVGEYITHATFENERCLSLDELKRYVVDSPNLNVNADSISVKYTIADSCFGYKFLIVKFINLGIYMQDDNSPVDFVFTVQDDEVNMVYFADQWARRGVSILSGGKISEDGSYGAGAHGGSLAILDQTGHYKFIEKSDELIYNFIAMYIDAEAVNNFEGITLTTINTDSGDYYSIKIDDSASYNDVNILEDYLKGEGMTKIDDINEPSEKILDSMGISANYNFEHIEDWTDIS